MKKFLHVSAAFTAILFTSICSAQCPDSVVVFTADFENTDGGLISGGFGDWEYGDIPTILLGTGCETSYTDPIGAHSGTKGWGTVLLDCYANAGDTSVLSLTVDLSDPTFTSARIDYWNWFELFTGFDYLFVKVNGTEVLFNDTQPLQDVWSASTLDLTPYVGQSSVTISFHLFATAVVNKAGWYIDDVSVVACTGPISVSESYSLPMHIWPNPSTGDVYVDLGNSYQGQASWSLLDASGRVVRQGTESSASGTVLLSFEGIQGMHILEWRTEQGIARERLILE